MSNVTYIYCIGNIFSKPADCYVNSVNCVGVQDSGMALDFKKRFNKAYEEYKELCKNNTLDLFNGGSMHVDKHPSVNNGKNCYIYQFPTRHFEYENSLLDTIENGMIDLVETLNINNDIKIVSIPAIGCGIGGLNKKDVEEIIKKEINKNIKRDIIVNLWNF